MRKNRKFFAVVLGVMIAMSGCGKSETASSKDTKVEDSNVTAEIADKAETNETEESGDKAETNKAEELIVKEIETKDSKAAESKSVALESTWQATEDVRQKFNVNFAAYYTKDFGLTAGMGGEIHYTTDGGANWPKAENSSKCCFGIDFVNENVIYVCGNGENVVKSTDGGKTFTRVANFGGSSPTQCKMLSFCDENNGMIASVKKMAITNDGGTTWKELTIPCEVAGIYMTQPEKLYFVGKDLNMYQSEDGGQTWSATALNLPEQDDYYNVPQAIAFTVNEDGYTLFATQKSTKLLKNYVSEDFGATWTEYQLPEIKSHLNLYLNDQGDVLSANNTLKMSACMVTKN